MPANPFDLMTDVETNNTEVLAVLKQPEAMSNEDFNHLYKLTQKLYLVSGVCNYALIDDKHPIQGGAYKPNPKNIGY